MPFLRRRLAMLALSMAVALACGAASVSAAVCMGGATSSISADDCCPAGSHPGQQCPMHRHGSPHSLDRKAPAFCGCRSLSPIGIAAIGVMPIVPVLSSPIVLASVHETLADATIDAPPVPTAPPPRA